MRVIGFTEAGTIRVEMDGAVSFVPDDMVNPYRRLIRDWEDEGNAIPPYFPAPPAAEYRLYKTTLWMRLSDEDAETVMAAKALQPAKFRGIWDDAQIIESDSEFFGALKAFLTATLNAEKAEALLQPET